MVAKNKSLKVVYSPTAAEELEAIWKWNAERYSANHANRYLAFLKNTIDGLADTYRLGRPVNIRPELQYIVITRRRRGHGHLVVYAVIDFQVSILHIFHTAQDWLTRLAE